jgi:hypothetical protein
VKKSDKNWSVRTENKRVSGQRNADFAGVLEVVANKEVREILGWAGEWCDHGFRGLSINILNEMVAARTGG